MEDATEHVAQPAVIDEAFDVEVASAQHDTQAALPIGMPAAPTTVVVRAVGRGFAPIGR